MKTLFYELDDTGHIGLTALFGNGPSIQVPDDWDESKQRFFKVVDGVLTEDSELIAEAEEADKWANMPSLADRLSNLEALEATPFWMELGIGDTLTVGDKVRYFGKVYRCISSHTKSLLTSPVNDKYWTT